MILSKVILLSLSKEALSAMIEQFALQDQAFDLPYTPCSDSYTPAEDTHSKGRITPWDGRGCFALSLVSRRFHDLTAPFILEVRVESWRGGTFAYSNFLTDSHEQRCFSTTFPIQIGWEIRTPHPSTRSQ